jgi:hypothetical protein
LKLTGCVDVTGAAVRALVCDTIFIRFDFAAFGVTEFDFSLI